MGVSVIHMAVPRSELIWPVHFHTTEHQRRILEDFAHDNRISLGEAARTLVDAGLRSQGLA
jgi:hypothetical protein